MPPRDLLDLVESHLSESAATQRRVAESCAAAIVIGAERIVEALRSGGKLMLCGNGGSAADCQHMAAELVATMGVDRPGLSAIALTTDSCFLTAYSNDHGFEGVFERQLEALGRPGDLLLAISTSGESANVVRALECARRGGIASVVLCGSGGRLAGMADVAIAVPSRDVAHTQEAHLAIEHLLCRIVERMLLRSG